MHGTLDLRDDRGVGLFEVLRSGERPGIRSVLVVAAGEGQPADVDGERRRDQQDDEGEREQDQRDAAFAAPVATLAGGHGQSTKVVAFAMLAQVMSCSALVTTCSTT